MMVERCPEYNGSTEERVTVLEKRRRDGGGAGWDAWVLKTSVYKEKGSSHGGNGASKGLQREAA